MGASEQNDELLQRSPCAYQKACARGVGSGQKRSEETESLQPRAPETAVDEAATTSPRDQSVHTPTSRAVSCLKVSEKVRFPIVGTRQHLEEMAEALTPSISPPSLFRSAPSPFASLRKPATNGSPLGQASFGAATPVFHADSEQREHQRPRKAVRTVGEFHVPVREKDSAETNEAVPSWASGQLFPTMDRIGLEQGYIKGAPGAQAREIDLRNIRVARVPIAPAFELSEISLERGGDYGARYAVLEQEVVKLNDFILDTDKLRAERQHVRSDFEQHQRTSTPKFRALQESMEAKNQASVEGLEQEMAAKVKKMEQVKATKIEQMRAELKERLADEVETQCDDTQNRLSEMSRLETQIEVARNAAVLEQGALSAKSRELFLDFAETYN